MLSVTAIKCENCQSIGLVNPVLGFRLDEEWTDRNDHRIQVMKCPDCGGIRPESHWQTLGVCLWDEHENEGIPRTTDDSPKIADGVKLNSDGVQAFDAVPQSWPQWDESVLQVRKDEIYSLLKSSSRMDFEEEYALRLQAVWLLNNRTRNSTETLSFRNALSRNNLLAEYFTEEEIDIYLEKYQIRKESEAEYQSALTSACPGTLDGLLQCADECIPSEFKQGDQLSCIPVNEINQDISDRIPNPNPMTSPDHSDHANLIDRKGNDLETIQKSSQALSEFSMPFIIQEAIDEVNGDLDMARTLILDKQHRINKIPTMRNNASANGLNLSVDDTENIQALIVLLPMESIDDFLLEVELLRYLGKFKEAKQTLYSVYVNHKKSNDTSHKYDALIKALSFLCDQECTLVHKVEFEPTVEFTCVY